MTNSITKPVTWAPQPAVPGEPPAPCDGGTPMISPQENLGTFWTERAYCLGYETHYGMQGKSISGLRKKLWDVWEEPNIGKEQDQGGVNTWKGGIRVKSVGHMQTMQTSGWSGNWSVRFVLSPHWTTFPIPFLHQRTLFNVQVCIDVCMLSRSVCANVWLLVKIKLD